MNKPGENKPPLHLLPDVLEETAQVLADGAQKHGEFGWRELDNPPSEWLDAAQRHILAFNRGETTDPDSGHHHIAHAIADVMIALEKDRAKPRIRWHFEETHLWRSPRWWDLPGRRRLREITRKLEALRDENAAFFFHATSATASPKHNDQ